MAGKNQNVSRLLSVALLFFVLAGVVCMAVGTRIYFQESGIISSIPKTTRAKITPAPEFRITRPTPANQVPGPPTAFRAPDGTEMVGRPIASPVKDPSFSEPGKSNDFSKSKSNVDLAAGGTSASSEFSRKSSTIKGI